MAKPYTIYAPMDYDMQPIKYMECGEYADVWLRKNIHTEAMQNSVYDADTGEQRIESIDTQVATEVHFRVETSKVTEADIRENFEKYWAYGENWKEHIDETDAEKIARLQAENDNLRRCIAELSQLM